jgi:hypothetical protein
MPTNTKQKTLKRLHQKRKKTPNMPPKPTKIGKVKKPTIEKTNKKIHKGTITKYYQNQILSKPCDNKKPPLGQ